MKFLWSVLICTIVLTILLCLLSFGSYAGEAALRPPVDGEVTKGFGVTTSPDGKRTAHTGLDYSAPEGSAVRAARKGVVLYTGEMKAYGKLVILNHGGGLSTVYAKLGDVACSEGFTVTEGFSVGSVGRRPLHFEVRRNGECVDPSSYLCLERSGEE